VPGLFSARSPLGLPTLSLAMAFSANPLVIAVNMPLMLWNAIPIAKRAWRVWSNERRLNVDFLDTLAIAASVMQANPLAGSLVTWLIKLGDWIRDLTAAGSRRAISDLLEFRSKSAWILRDGQVTAIPAAELVVGDLVVVYPGEMIPVDGEIVEGFATIDQKTITGEGLPVTRGKGGAAFAATVIREGQLTIRAIRIGTDTTAGQIARLVESAPLGDTRMQNHAELLADRLVLPTLGLAASTAALTADFGRFLSLVIVDYGTGIRVAAPTSVLSSMTHAARAGIVIKSGGHMEKLAKADTIVFDKTGTLTHGVPAIVDVIGYVDHITPGHLLGLAAAAETRLHHPVAEALRTRAKELAVNMPPCDETQYRVGLGVEGQVNGYYLHVGSGALHAPERDPTRCRRGRPRFPRSQRLFRPLCRGGRQARRTHRLCRQGAAGKPRGNRPTARNGHPQHRHADRRQCSGGEGRQRAPRPDRGILRHAAGGQGGRHPGTATPRQCCRHGR
jgi:Cu2+-exporting ATPase